MLTILVVVSFSGSPFLKNYATEAECIAMKQKLVSKKFEAFCLPVKCDTTPSRRED